jgi:nucleotide-binding universal stress UspA family protein
VIGFDGSAESMRALTWAAATARRRGAVLDIIHVGFASHELAHVLAPDAVVAQRQSLGGAVARAKALEPSIMVQGRIGKPPRGRHQPRSAKVRSSLQLTPQCARLAENASTRKGGDHVVRRRGVRISIGPSRRCDRSATGPRLAHEQRADKGGSSFESDRLHQHSLASQR